MEVTGCVVVEAKGMKCKSIRKYKIKFLPLCSTGVLCSDMDIIMAGKLGQVTSIGHKLSETIIDEVGYEI